MLNLDTVTIALFYSIYCIVVSSLLFSPSADKLLTCKISSDLPALISL